MSEETRKKISEKQRQNTYRRVMRHTQEYHGNLYDSSWEIELAKRLETLGEPFERPKWPIQYTDKDGKKHNYFPDFYLLKRQVFIEVKNPYLFENDSKVKILRTERQDIIWLTSLDQIQSFEYDENGNLKPFQKPLVVLKKKKKTTKKKGYFKISDEIWQQRRDMILNSGVDLTKFGCLTEILKKVPLTRRQVCLTMERFNIPYKTRKA